MVGDTGLTLDQIADMKKSMEEAVYHDDVDLMDGLEGVSYDSKKKRFTIEERGTMKGRLNGVTPAEWDAASRDWRVSYKNGPMCSASEPVKAKDVQVGGDHYKNSNHQPYEVLLERHGYECFRGACLKDIDKYLARYKDNRLEDYKKAQHLLGWLIEETENAQRS